MLACSICRSDAKPYFVAALTQYYQCPRCGLVFTDHVPQQTYRQWSKSPGYVNWEEYLPRVFTRIVRDIQLFKPAGRVLEIGSSLGYMLVVLNAAGFEG